MANIMQDLILQVVVLHLVSLCKIHDLEGCVFDREGLLGKLAARRGGCTKSVCKLWPTPSLIQWQRYLNCSVSLSADLKRFGNREVVSIDRSRFPLAPFQVCHVGATVNPDHFSTTLTACIICSCIRYIPRLLTTENWKHLSLK